MPCCRSQTLVFYIIIIFLLSACGGSNKVKQPPTTPSTPAPETSEPAFQPFTIGLLPDTQGGTDANGQAHVSVYPMREVVAHQAVNGVNMIIALGDLTDKGSDIEFAEWRSVADAYAEEGIEFSPVMGNQETSYA